MRMAKMIFKNFRRENIANFRENFAPNTDYNLLMKLLHLSNPYNENASDKLCKVRKVI